MTADIVKVTTPNVTALTESEARMLLPDNISVTLKNGIRVVEGVNENGDKVVIETILSSSEGDDASGFRQKTLSVCNELPIKERRKVALMLKKEKRMSQTEIAKKLGVSQKTISVDLASQQKLGKDN